MIGVLWALLAGCAFGLSNVFARMSMARVTAFTATFWSVGINSLIFALIVGIRFPYTAWPELSTAGLLLFALAGLFSNVGGRTSLFASSAYIGVSRASAFRIAAPIVTAVLGITVLGEALTWVMVVGLVVILGGLLLISLESTQSHGARYAVAESSGTDAAAAPMEASHGAERVKKGLIFGVIAAATFGGGDVLRKAGMNVIPDSLIASFVTSIVGTFFLTVIAAAMGRAKSVLRPAPGALRYLIPAGLLSAAALFSFFTSLNYLPVSIATPINGTQALFAALFGWLLNDSVEHVRAKLIAGSIIVIVGLALIVLG